ncbi:hypothetical protein ACVWWR_005765 [Bradyrhizobium sp. LM3.2]
MHGALPPPRAGEDWGEGISASGLSGRGKNPHPALRADLSRKRARCTVRAARPVSNKLTCGSTMPPRLKLRDIAFFERPVHFARPFRFGAITINATPQLFVRVEIEVEGKGTAVGASAELLVPKWFDKRPELSPAQTVDDLRRSLEIARRLYLARTGFLTGIRSACLVHRCPGRDLCEKEYSGACGGLRPRGNRQGDPRRAPARGRDQFFRRHGRQHRRHRCAAVA